MSFIRNFRGEYFVPKHSAQFLGFGLADEVRDATTVWLCRKQLSEQGLIESLFEFDGYLIEQGYAAQGGQISYESSQAKVPSAWVGNTFTYIYLYENLHL